MKKILMGLFFCGCFLLSGCGKQSSSDVIKEVCDFAMPGDSVLRDHIEKTIKPLLEGDPKNRQLVIKRSKCVVYEPIDVMVSFS